MIVKQLQEDGSAPAMLLPPYLLDAFCRQTDMTGLRVCQEHHESHKDNNCTELGRHRNATQR